MRSLLHPLRLGLFLSGLWFLCWPTSIRAQTPAPLHLVISPSVVELAIQPGKTVTQAFLVKNEGTTDVEVTPQLRDFEASNIPGVPRLLPSSSFPYADLANSEIHLNEPFLLPAGASEQLVLHIAVPEAAAEQDWYFALLASTKPEQASTIDAFGTGATTQGTIGANVLVRITQDNLIPLEWDITVPLPRFIDSLQQMTFTPEVMNKGDTYAVPQLTVTVLDWRQHIVNESQALPERILAHSSRAMQAEQTRKDDPRSTEGVPFQLGPRFALGPYTVRASIANSAGGPVVIEQQVIALPFSLLAAFLALIFSLQLLQWYRRRSAYPRETDSL